jgi:DNA (cytosine-5)-methyltransferase 1
LSIEEYKRIQEFPDEYEVCGTLLDQYRQVGNAVPASLGRAIGQAILAHHRGDAVPNFVGFPYSRYRDTDEASWERSMRQAYRQPAKKHFQAELEGILAAH